jgi:8-oxo-dGTP pyrophosphatase MutT (NUDIX family)
MKHSYLDIVKIADAFPYPEPGSETTINDYVHFRIAALPDVTLGLLLADVAVALENLPEWYLDLTSTPKTITMIDGGDYATRSAIMERTTFEMRTTGRFKLLNKWRDERFPVYRPDKELLFSIERSASPLFGVVVYGVNLTAFRWDGGGDKQGRLQIWVPRRSSTRAKFANMLDSSVDGGLALGETPWSCVIRESEEEASLKEDLVRTAKEIGTVSYFYVSGEGLGGEIGLAQPECSYIFDLDLTGHPPDALVMNDDSVTAFALSTVDEVKLALSHKEFKPNCALVMLDFLTCHG